MGRHKKPVEIEEVKVIEEKVEKLKLGKFDFEFNNEGLNKLRDKLNEIIAYLNQICR